MQQVNPIRTTVYRHKIPLLRKAGRRTGFEVLVRPYPNTLKEADGSIEVVAVDILKPVALVEQDGSLDFSKFWKELRTLCDAADNDELYLMIGGEAS